MVSESASVVPQDDAFGLYSGFEGYRTPSSEDYHALLTTGMVVPDTNVLLNLYRYSSSTREDLFAVLASLGNRLWVPHQVLVEFWKNRESAVRDPRETGENTVEGLEDYSKQAISSLRTWANRVAWPTDLRDELEDGLKESFDSVIENIQRFISEEALGEALDTSKDPVLKRLEPILRNRVGKQFDLEKQSAALQEAQRRIDVELPPGYKDRSKGDDASSGDYLIWEQLLCEAERRQSDVLLVTGDVKDDWWRRERGQTRGPRLELVDELRDRAGTRLFMLRPDSLLLHAREVLKLQIRDESVEDVERVDKVLLATEAEEWTSGAVQHLMLMLYAEAPVQGYSVYIAAQNDGFVGREKVYKFGGYSEGRMLRGFTRPVNRIAQRTRSRYGVSSDSGEDIFRAVYEPGDVQASGFRIVAPQLIPLIKDFPEPPPELIPGLAGDA
jgi:PIN like domain